MMTREETITNLEKLAALFYTESKQSKMVDYSKIIEALEFAAAALRLVSRERVEKVFPGCDYCKHAWMEGLDLKPCASGNIGVELTIGRVSEDDAFGILAYYRNTAAGYIDFPFCPFCGAPMTDEAVQMVMERLEELKDGKDD